MPHEPMTPEAIRAYLGADEFIAYAQSELLQARLAKFFADLEAGIDFTLPAAAAAGGLPSEVFGFLLADFYPDYFESLIRPERAMH